MRNKILTKIEDINKIAIEMAEIERVIGVYLFGSHARNKVGPLSDIDICVIGDLTQKEQNKILEYSSDNLDICFFNDLPNYIQFRVLKEGKSLIVKDKNVVDSLKIITLKTYLDFKPLINKYVKEVLNV